METQNLSSIFEMTLGGGGGGFTQVSLQNGNYNCLFKTMNQIHDQANITIVLFNPFTPDNASQVQN